MVGIQNTSSFLVDAYTLIEQEKARKQPRILNKIVFLMEDEQGQLIKIKWFENLRNIIGQPPFCFG